MHSRKPLKALLAIFIVSLPLAGSESVASWKQTAVVKAPEANQAAAADEHFFYAIDNAVVAKYDRNTGQRIAVSTGPAKHLNSGFLWNDRLYCAHSNYPQTPELSEIKVLDVKTMQLAQFKDFGNYGGSLTWAVRHEDHWWCNFAKYDNDNAKTILVKFDDEWKQLGRWTYPPDVIRQLGRYSLSGGIWRDGFLLVTGHDDPIVFRLRLPKSGSILEYLDNEAVPFTGQGIAHDPKSGGLVGIHRGKRQIVVAAAPHERTERFDRDPGWDGRNHRAVVPRTIRQDFGFSTTAHAGGKPGEMGGFITPAAEPAFYAKKLPHSTFKDKLTASGTLACNGQAFHALIGFFNADTLNEWRTPNAISLRISGRGDVFYAWLEYATQKWRAGGDSPQSFPTELDPATGRQQFKGFASKGVVHRWTLDYDPTGNNGLGVVTATIDGVKAVCNLADGHKEDGAVFNRFGLLNLMKSADTGGEVWLDDIAVNGQNEDFSKDPGWEGFHNRRTHETRIVRPHFDFGFSPTQFAGGAGSGELGGLIFRGDCRYPERMAFYGDRLGSLTLEKPLRASGKVCLKRGVTDSGVLIGFFHSKDSTAVTPSQASGIPKNFLGISTDGPSREGFLVAPIYRVHGDRQGYASGQLPRIYPDGKPHDWSVEYSPTEADGKGQITVTLDKQTVKLVLGEGHRTAGGRFDRFGLISTWVDGNSQTIYFDDLTYTWKQE